MQSAQVGTQLGGSLVAGIQSRTTVTNGLDGGGNGSLYGTVLAVITAGRQRLTTAETGVTLRYLRINGRLRSRALGTQPPYFISHRTITFNRHSCVHLSQLLINLLHAPMPPAQGVLVAILPAVRCYSCAIVLIPSCVCSRSSCR